VVLLEGVPEAEVVPEVEAEGAAEVVKGAAEVVGARHQSV
jgi:hypothetical protein